jgi:Spy/CpxP family protein refolding chaperone
MPSTRGRTAKRKNDDNKPSNGPRSQSRSSNSSKHPSEKRNQSASGRSQNSGGNHKPHHNHGPHVQKELTEEQKQHLKFHRDQQQLINEVISSITEKQMLAMLENIHTKGILDATKSAAAT